MKTSTKDAAEAIKDMVKADRGAQIARDEKNIIAVLRELKLPDTPVNRVQVAAALDAKGIDTKDEYPKQKYRLNADGEVETIVVLDEASEGKIGAGWSDEKPEPKKTEGVA